MLSDSPAPAAGGSIVLPRLTLVLGGARSGKSRYAEGLIGGREAVYLATSQAWDAEMAERITHHRDRRGGNWLTVEEPLDLAAALAAQARPDRPILVDCLTLWLTNILLAERDVPAEMAALVAALPGLAGPVVLVSNEVGQGIVPDNKLARLFRDHAGRLHQDIAAIADKVVFVIAGLPQILKDQT